MGKSALLDSEVKRIKKLRETGHSLNEIKSVVNRGYGTIFRYIKDVKILPEYENEWKIKRGGSKNKSLKDWESARIQASKFFDNFSAKERLLILSCLYWGEGNKRELNLINSDPYLIKVFLNCIRDLGVCDAEITISLRLHENIDKRMAVRFWLDFLNFKEKSITYFEIIKGNKIGKLKYGMCRLRVKKGAKYFKLIMSMIDLVRSSF